MPVIDVAQSIPEHWVPQLQVCRTGTDPSAALIPTHDLAEFDCSFEVGEFHLNVHDASAGWRPTRDFILQRADGAG